MAREKLVNKQLLKRVAGKCRLCPSDAYHVLDVHRIVPGEQGGRYTHGNSVVLCSNCHRDIHEGTLEIIRWVESTGGRLLWIMRNGKEEFV